MAKKGLVELAEEAGVEVRFSDELAENVSEHPPKEYLAAMFTFLNRADQSEKAMAYPITKIQLFSRMSADNPNGEPVRTFVVEGDHWKEEKQ